MPRVLRMSEVTCAYCGKAFVRPTHEVTSMQRRGRSGPFCSHSCVAQGTLPRPAEERFWEKVQKTDGCWLWTGAKSPDGYGGFHVGGDRRRRMVGAHRFAYELLVEPIAEGLTIDHLCRNPSCVNPSHLEVVTYGENNRRMWVLLKAKRTQWKCGHLATEENTYQYRYRGCLTCRRASARAAARRQRAKRRMVAG